VSWAAGRDLRRRAQQACACALAMGDVSLARRALGRERWVLNLGGGFGLEFHRALSVASQRRLTSALHLGCVGDEFIVPVSGPSG
jgi:hypothetical protein